MMRSVYRMLYSFFILLQINHALTEQCLSDQWPPKSQITIPRYTVDLDQSPSVRWNQIASSYSVQVKNVLSYIKSFIANELPILTPLFNSMLTKLPVIADTLPTPYGEELQGISQVTGIPLGEVVLYNIFYELSSLCTSIVAQDIHGNVFHGRNLDFGLFLGWNRGNRTWTLTNKLRPLVISVDYMRNGRLLFQTTTFAGFIGTVTGFKPDTFSIALNARFEPLNGGFIGVMEWIYNIDRQQSFVTFAIRDVLTTAISYDQAVEYLTELHLLVPCYYTIAGTKPNEGVIISRSRKASMDLKKLADHQWFLIQTNYDHWNPQPSFDDRLTPAIKCIQIQGQNNLTFASLFNLLSSRPMLNKLTIYTSLMQPKTAAFQSYIQICNDQETICPLW